MLFNDQNSQNSDISQRSEKVLPYKQLRGLVEKILKGKVSKPPDIEDISQDVFRRSWQWANKNKRQLSHDEWRRLIAKITFNEINRFYSKKVDLLSADHLPEDSDSDTLDATTLNPQFILEIAEQLRTLSFRQRLSVVLFGGEILPYLKVVLPVGDIAALLEIDKDFLEELEPEIPLTEQRITEVIEEVTQKECRSSIRDERSKGRKLLRRRLFKE